MFFSKNGEKSKTSLGKENKKPEDTQDQDAIANDKIFLELSSADAEAKLTKSASHRKLKGSAVDITTGPKPRRRGSSTHRSLTFISSS